MATERKERIKQGTLESEFSCEGETGLHRHFNECEKNPGHSNFIPVDEFNMSYFPSGYHDDDILNLVRAMSDLTVRVTVKYVSEDRPETFPGSDKPYPYSSYKGRNKMRTGTGWVSGVAKYMDETIFKPCECKECSGSPTPKTQFARIYIITAAHVVYDDRECQNTTCHLFFDRGLTPANCPGVVTLSGMPGFNDVNTSENDAYQMSYVTHDLELADFLEEICYYSGDLLERVEKKYRTVKYDKLSDTKSVTEFNTDKSEVESLPNAMHTLTIIVSHPHGCSKQVSIGHCTNMDQMEHDASPFMYTTPTCRGSSGARVCVLGRDWWGDWGNGHPHSGNCEGNKKLNYSAYAL